jgi:hypothetical protein
MMDDATFAAESHYLRQLADLLGLRDWHITLSRGPSDHDSRAQVYVHRNKDELTVQLNEGWSSMAAEQQRLTLTHELLHAHTGRLCRVVTRLTGLEGPHMEYVRKAHDEEEEIVIQRLARVIAPHLPLPG